MSLLKRLLIIYSSSDLSSLAASPGALALLTPTSRRKQLLLLQHQQRSSLDTDALDEEFDASQVCIEFLEDSFTSLSMIDNGNYQQILYSDV